MTSGGGKAAGAAAVHRVVVCASGAQADSAASLARSLSGPALTADCSGFDTPAPDADLLLQLVAPDDLPAALRQLQVLRAAPGGGPVLVAGLALSPDDLGRLLCAGACDFVRLPADPTELRLRVRHALGLDGPATPAAGAGPQPRHPALRGLVGDSPAFAQQVARIPVFARHDANVMILGDTGTGKEVCAQAIHYLSARATGPWVAVNCAAIPTELIEAELFGHVRGAYTNAHVSRQGLVREAEGGTLFLDEVDSLPFGAQGKLLRFLQEKEYRPVGSNTVQHADVRIIAASNRPLTLLGTRQGFRQDLLYRLNVLTLHLPPLRERRGDIAPLAQHFVHAAAVQWHKPPPGLSPAALKKLLAHEWPGNLRELKNVIERAVLLCDGSALGAHDIDFDGAPSPTAPPTDDESFRAAKARLVENFERQYIEHLLSTSHGNITQAARAAKKNRRAFFELMRKYSIASEAFRDSVGGQA